MLEQFRIARVITQRVEHRVHREVYEERIPFLEALLDAIERLIHFGERGVHQAEGERAPVSRRGFGAFAHEPHRRVALTGQGVGQGERLSGSVDWSVGFDRPFSDRNRLVKLVLEKQGVYEFDLGQQLPRVDGEAPPARLLGFSILPRARQYPAPVAGVERRQRIQFNGAIELREGLGEPALSEQATQPVQLMDPGRRG